MSEKIFITVGKVLKDGVEFEYDITNKKNGNGKPPRASYTYSKDPHPDLTGAFKRLAIHVAVMAYQVKKSEIGDITDPGILAEDFHCTSFHIKGTEKDVQSYKLHGYMKLPNGKTLGLECPLERNADADAKDGYLFIEDLRAAVIVCQQELAEYMGGKYAADPQQDLFAEPAGDFTDIASGPKKGGKKKNAEKLTEAIG
jgi:hypothetical protein